MKLSLLMNKSDLILTLEGINFILSLGGKVYFILTYSNYIPITGNISRSIIINRMLIFGFYFDLRLYQFYLGSRSYLLIRNILS
jgi:hypothetical protein